MEEIVVDYKKDLLSNVCRRSISKKISLTTLLSKIEAKLNQFLLERVALSWRLRCYNIIHNMQKTVSFCTINDCNTKREIASQNKQKSKELPLQLSKSTESLLKASKLFNAKANKVVTSLTHKYNSIDRSHRESS